LLIGRVSVNTTELSEKLVGYLSLEENATNLPGKLKHLITRLENKRVHASNGE